MENEQDEDAILEKLEAALTNDASSDEPSGAGITARLPAAVATHKTAPNPILSFKLSETTFKRTTTNTRHIGLPLSADDAVVLKNASSADRGAIKSSFLRVGNSNWQEWVASHVLKLVEADLGVNSCTISPLREAYIHGDCNTYESKDFTRPNTPRDVFGTAVIILPSLTQYEFYLSLDGSTIDSSNKRIIANTQALAASVAIAVWYNGASQKFITRTLGAYALILSYDLIHTGSGEIPQLPDNSSTLTEVEQALSSWREIPARDGKAKTLTWVLNNHYSKLGPKTKLKGLDKISFQILSQCAKALGYKLLAADLKYTRAGRVRDYCTPEYSEDECEDATEDMSIGEEDTAEVEVVYTTDLQAGYTLPKGLGIKADMEDENILPRGWDRDVVDNRTATLSDLDRYAGELTCVYDCTALILIPGNEYGRSAAQMFSFRAAYLIDERLWDGDEVSRMEFATHLISSLPVLELEMEPEPIPTCSYSYKYSEYEKREKEWAVRVECNDRLFKFTLDQRRFDLAVQVASKLGTENLELYDRAAKEFPFETEQGKESYSVFVQTCAQKQRGTFRKIEVVQKLLAGNESMTHEILDTLFETQPLAKQYLSVNQVFDVEKVVGKGLLKSCIFPKLQNYHETGFWLELLQKLSDLCESTSEGEYYSDLFNTYFSQALASYVCINWQHAPQLLSLCLERQRGFLSDVLSKFIEGTDKKNPEFEKNPHGTAITRVSEIAKTLKKHGIPVSDHTAFFQRYFLRHILPLLGPRPTTRNVRSVGKKPGICTYKVRTVKCKQSPACKDCTALNSFLSSKTLQTERFPYGIKRREHLIDMLEAAEHPNVTIHNKEALTVTKKGFDMKEVEKGWERVRKEVSKAVKEHREGLSEMFELFEMGVEEGGDGWTASLETTANGIIGESVLVDSDVNVNKGKRKAAAKVSKGKKGRKRAKAGDVIDLTEA